MPTPLMLTFFSFKIMISSICDPPSQEYAVCGKQQRKSCVCVQDQRKVHNHLIAGQSSERTSADRKTPPRIQSKDKHDIAAQSIAHRKHRRRKNDASGIPQSARITESGTLSGQSATSMSSRVSPVANL